ncbi:MAG: nucleotidyl transferase AbiEii/AbiGii toxin family protein [Acidobacteria bacterium]|jgi:predicted nucleotidyltransferase|nr:nucleotidyl transferase AbiEii/AbiGii toxin family protein [Acidobacteriota bacterium]
MSRLESVLRAVSSDFSRLGVRWALVGGLAVSARSEPRFTRDIDAAVAVADDRQAERIVSDLLGLGYAVLASLEQTATGRLASIRLVPPGEAAGGVVVDLLFASSGIEPEIVERAHPLEVLPGLSLPVATIGDLIALKLLARDDEHRPQDAGDLAALFAAATDADRDRVGAAIGRIAALGFQRDRDLEAAWRAWLERPGPG